MPIMHSNRIFTLDGNSSEAGCSIAAWQDKGHDLSTVVDKVPVETEILRLAREILYFEDEETATGLRGGAARAIAATAALASALAFALAIALVRRGAYRGQHSSEEAEGTGLIKSLTTATATHRANELRVATRQCGLSSASE